jgi:hypothetical protein
MTKKVQRLFPQIPQIFFADLRKFLKYNLENPRKSAEKICGICGKISPLFLSCTEKMLIINVLYNSEIPIPQSKKEAQSCDWARRIIIRRPLGKSVEGNMSFCELL